WRAADRPGDDPPLDGRLGQRRRPNPRQADPLRGPRREVLITASDRPPQSALGRFGDYGRILKSHPHTFLAKDLAPPGPVSIGLKYRQAVPGMYDVHGE